MAIQKIHWSGRRPTRWALFLYLASWRSQCKMSTCRYPHLFRVDTI
jgi:hypothetical protein